MHFHEAFPAWHVPTLLPSGEQVWLSWVMITNSFLANDSASRMRHILRTLWAADVNYSHFGVSALLCIVSSLILKQDSANGRKCVQETISQFSNFALSLKYYPQYTEKPAKT